MASSTRLTNNYFASRKPSSWSFSSFTTELTQQQPTIKLGDVNSRFLTALRKIVASTSYSPSARAKAQSLIDIAKSKSKKRPHQPENLVIHGDVNFAPEGQIIHSGGGDVSIAQENRTTAKRQRRELTPVEDSTTGEDGNHQEHNQNEEDGDDNSDSTDGTAATTTGEDGNHQEHNQNEGDGDGNSDSTDSTAATVPPDNDRFRSFDAEFRAMNDKKRLASGRILEDIIHTRVAQDPSSAGEAIHWIIDLSDRSTHRKWFSKPELGELLASLPTTPQVDEYFTYAKARYRNCSTALELREIAESKPTPPGVRYDRKSNFNATYVNSAAGAILSMIEQSDSNESFGTQGHKEGWYGSKLWSTVLDHCMDDMDNFTVSRAEIQSKSGCPSKRFDAIFLGHAGVKIAEFGAVEVARTEDVLVPGKCTYDEQKLRDVMVAMLMVLLAHVDHDPETAKLLQVVGVQQIGFNIQISTMYSINKQVFILKKGIWRKVPNKLKNFGSIFDVMQSVVIMKNIIQRTVDAIKAYHVRKAERTEGFEL